MNGQEEASAKRRRRSLRIACAAGAALLSAAGVFSLFLPLPERIEAARREAYVCVWENGRVSEENFSSAYAKMTATSASEIVLYGEEGAGVVSPSQEYRRAYGVLSNGSLAEAYALKPLVNRLERAALWRAFGDCVWYDNGYFVWDGACMQRSDVVKRSEVVLLNGKITARSLTATGAKKLTVRAQANFSASALDGTAIETIAAEEPYFVQAGALYWHTAGETRLIAGVPTVHSLIVGGNDWADEGALYACEKLEELVVPFAGNTGNTGASAYTGELAWLFLRSGEYRVPDGLKSVTVLGGSLSERAFYRFENVEEFSACGLNARDVSRKAFVPCTGWKQIHSPNSKIVLCGSYDKTPLACGCTLFTRNEEIEREIV